MMKADLHKVWSLSVENKSHSLWAWKKLVSLQRNIFVFHVINVRQVKIQPPWGPIDSMLSCDTELWRLFVDSGH